MLGKRRGLLHQRYLSHDHIRVLILLYMCPHTTKHVSSYCYICVVILTPEQAAAASAPGTQRLRCQYLYFCTSQASKLSKTNLKNLAKRRERLVERRDRRLLLRCSCCMLLLLLLMLVMLLVRVLLLLRRELG